MGAATLAHIHCNTCLHGPSEFMRLFSILVQIGKVDLSQDLFATQSQMGDSPIIHRRRIATSIPVVARMRGAAVETCMKLTDAVLQRDPFT